MALNPNDLKFSSYDWRWAADTKNIDTTFGYSLNTNQGRYVFIPESVISKGVTADNKQYYFDQFLNRDFLKDFYANATAVDFKDFTDFKDGDVLQKRLTQFGQPTQGFLVPESYVQKNLTNSQNYNLGTSAGKVSFGGIQGIGERNGELIYVPSVSGPSDAAAYITAGNPSRALNATYTQVKGGFLGSIFKSIASVPFLPEIAGIVTGNPMVYASLKGVQAGVQGKDPLQAALEIGSTIMLANTAGGSGSAGGESLGSGITPGSAGTTGLTAGAAGTTGLTAPPGFTLSPELGATLATSAALTQPQSANLLSDVTFPQQGLQVPFIDSAQVSLIPQGTALPGEGLLAPSLPAVGAMGGAQGLAVGVPGGTITQAGLTPTGAVPVLGDPASLINNPDVLGQPVITPEPSTISVQQALRGAQLVNQLMNPPEQQGMPMDQGGGMQAQGVDYSGLLALMQRQVGMPNIGGLLAPAQIRYPNSLLG
jgi:hypothetical protein